jgi:TonB family protein
MAAIVASVFMFHVAVILGLDTGSLLANQGGDTSVDLATSCTGDAVLGSGLRYSLCFGPWQDDPDACLRDAELNMWIDLSACRAQQSPDAIASIAMLTPRAADKVTPIDPEPLLAMIREQEQPQPPKPPELQPQPQPQPTPPPPPPPPAPQRPMQVVENAKPNSEKEPENARFLAEHNTVVEKQSVARGSVQEPMVAKSKPAELAPKEAPKEASVKETDPDRQRGANRDAPDTKGPLAMRKPGVDVPSTIQQDAKVRGAASGTLSQTGLDGMTPKKGDGSFEQERKQRSEIPRGQAGAGGGAPEVPNLKPSPEVLERALGGGSVDHLDDVSDGDETALNAKRWIHATFFNRLKRQVAQNWDPASVWRRRDPTGQVYGTKTRITEVRVSLTSSGTLAKIVVTAPSGVSELDDEAVRAFREAAPFVNPPKELAGGDGMITFAFSFYFEVGAPRSSWRVIRSM